LKKAGSWQLAVGSKSKRLKEKTKIKAKQLATFEKKIYK